MGASRAASAPQRGAIVVELYVRQAVSARQISKITGIPRPEVTSLLRAAGIEMAPRGLGRPRTRARQQFPKRLDAQLSELYVRRRLTRKVVAHALGLSEWMIRRRLAELGVPMRSRGGWYRENRSEPDPDEIFRLYLAYGWSANLVGAQLGISRKVVLRTVHEHGWPVKIGGPPPRGGPEEIALVRALYEDGLVARVLREWGVTEVEPGAAIWRRFPVPLEIPASLLQTLYLDCGLSLQQIELLTGQPVPTLAHRLRGLGVRLRPPGGRSPFMRRWRAKEQLSAATKKHRGRQSK
jgi:hypothetical protein